MQSIHPSAPLTLNEGLGGLALRIQRVKFLIENGTWSAAFVHSGLGRSNDEVGLDSTNAESSPQKMLPY
jgi:hypothetical protein